MDGAEPLHGDPAIAADIDAADQRDMDHGALLMPPPSPFPAAAG
jgi:hypothetical protein